MTGVYVRPRDPRPPVKRITAIAGSELPRLCFVPCAVKLSHLLPLYRSQDLPPLLHVPKFQEPDALPGSCCKLPI